MTGGEVAVVLAASLLSAFVKSVTGLGYALLAVPIITLALGIEDAVVIVAVPNVVASALLCWHERDAREDTRDLRALLVTSLVGAVVGTFLLVSVPEEPLLILLVLAIAAFIANFLASPDLRVSPATTSRLAPAVGLATGVMQGAVGAPGPVVAMWLHGYRLPAQAYVFSVNAIFGMAGTVQFLMLVGSGEVTGKRMLLSSLAVGPTLAILPVGSRLRARMNGRDFDLAVLSVLTVSGVALVVRILG